MVPVVLIGLERLETAAAGVLFDATCVRRHACARATEMATVC